MKAIFIVVIIAVSMFIHSKDQFKVRWEGKSESGGTFGIVFKVDSGFEGFRNNKGFGNGTYCCTPGDNLIAFQHDGGVVVQATSKVDFYNYSDSMRFAIKDNYAERKKECKN